MQLVFAQCLINADATATNPGSRPADHFVGIFRELCRCFGNFAQVRYFTPRCNAGNILAVPDTKGVIIVAFIHLLRLLDI